MRLLKKNELEGHDVFEFCYAKDYPNDWNEDSFFIKDDDFKFLVPYIDKVFFEFAYYGRQKVTLSEWEKVKQLVYDDKEQKEFINIFFNQLDDWLKKDINKCDYFWIFGL